MNKNVELELRAEVSPEDLHKIIKSLKKIGVFEGVKKRLSVLYIGDVEGRTFDIRVRITNGDSEVVIKKGALHAHDRKEYTYKIKNEDFVRNVELFSKFGFRSKIIERTHHNFLIRKDISLSLVDAGSIAYLELEKMTTPKDIKGDKGELISIAQNLNVSLIESKDEFDELCERLSEKEDKAFSGSLADLKRLKERLRAYSVK